MATASADRFGGRRGILGLAVEIIIGCTWLSLRKGGVGEGGGEGGERTSNMSWCELVGLGEQIHNDRNCRRDRLTSAQGRRMIFEFTTIVIVLTSGNHTFDRVSSSISMFGPNRKFLLR